MLRRLAVRLGEQDGRLDPIDLEDPQEKSALLDLRERLETYGFDEERAAQLLRDLIIRWLEQQYLQLTTRRNTTAWGGHPTRPPESREDGRPREQVLNSANGATVAPGSTADGKSERADGTF